jgi:hypothetical protein
MANRLWLQRIRSIFSHREKHRSRGKTRLWVRPRVEAFEDRVAPAVLTVNSTADNTTDTSVLTLRDAITLADDAGNPASLGQASMTPGWASQINTTTSPFYQVAVNTWPYVASPDTIQFAPNLTGQTITLNASLQIEPGSGQSSDDVSIVGPGAGELTISGAGQYQVFQVGSLVGPYSTASISGLTIKNGYTVLGGAAIHNNGNLTVSNCTLSDNVADDVYGYGLNFAAAYGGGGAIFNYEGNVTVNDCVLSDNSARDGFAGGAIYNSAGYVTINNSTLTANSTGNDGGAIYNYCVLTINNSTLYSNSATDGGGIYSNDSLDLTGSTLWGNSAAYAGYGGGIDDAATMYITNTTLAGNSAGYGGGLAYFMGNSLADNQLTNVTITGNQSEAIVYDPYTGARLSTGGGIWAPYPVYSNGQYDTELTLNNTIVASNVQGVNADDIDGVVNGAYNLIGTGGSGGLGNSNGNHVDVADQGLGDLTDYGGPTWTVPLLPGSPAMNAGNVALAVDPYIGKALTTDQRGFARVSPTSGSVDIGAFQSQPVTLSVTNTSDSGPGSLRQYVNDNNTLGGGNTIDFNIPTSDPGYNPLEGVFTIEVFSELLISQNVTVNGPGADKLAVSGDNYSTAVDTRVFEIAAAGFETASSINVSLSGLTIENGYGTTSGSVYGLYGWGGGVFNAGNLTVSYCTVANNTAVSGGGIFDAPGSTLNISNSAVYENSATDPYIESVGGGIFQDDGATLTASNSTFFANSAGYHGGALFIGNSQTTLTNVTIAGNHSNVSGLAPDSAGGGIFFNGGNPFPTLYNTIVADNFNGNGPPDDVDGSLSSASSYNLIGNGGYGGLLTDQSHGNRVTSPRTALRLTSAPSRCNRSL